MAGSGTVPRAEGKGLRCWRKIIWVGDSQKSNIDRTVDLTPNSVEWTTWALGELPNNGEIYYDRDLLKAIRKKADLWGKDSKGAKWPNDVARHSMNSYVVENKDFNVVGFWNSCLGREQAIFKKNYQGRVEYQLIGLRTLGFCLQALSPWKPPARRPRGSSTLKKLPLKQ
ncbi:MAG: hypothetical protein ACKVG9_11215 [Rhodospirillales bacterium]|jgi:hypothetical protein